MRVLVVLFLLGLAGCSSSVAAPAEDATPAAPAKSVLAGMSQKDICADSCLLLTTQSWDALTSGGYCKQCQAFDEFACELDWPSSDVPLCSMYDEMRNCIYAGYGRSFKTPKYQSLFAQKAWYKKDPAYRDDRLPKVAIDNAKKLQQLVKDGLCVKAPPG